MNMFFEFGLHNAAGNGVALPRCLAVARPLRSLARLLPESFALGSFGFLLHCTTASVQHADCACGIKAGRCRRANGWPLRCTCDTVTADPARVGVCRGTCPRCIMNKSSTSPVFLLGFRRCFSNFNFVRLFRPFCTLVRAHFSDANCYQMAGNVYFIFAAARLFDDAHRSRCTCIEPHCFGYSSFKLAVLSALPAGDAVAGLDDLRR